MSKVKVDISEYNRMVDRLTGKEMDKAMISAVRSGGQIIRKEPSRTLVPELLSRLSMSIKTVTDQPRDYHW